MPVEVQLLLESIKADFGITQNVVRELKTRLKANETSNFGIVEQLAREQRTEIELGERLAMARQKATDAESRLQNARDDLDSARIAVRQNEAAARDIGLEDVQENENISKAELQTRLQATRQRLNGMTASALSYETYKLQEERRASIETQVESFANTEAEIRRAIADIQNNHLQDIREGAERAKGRFEQIFNFLTERKGTLVLDGSRLICSTDFGESSSGLSGG